jgi:hypothetical protein
VEVATEEWQLLQTLKALSPKVGGREATFDGIPFF